MNFVKTNGVYSIGKTTCLSLICAIQDWNDINDEKIEIISKGKYSILVKFKSELIII